MRCEYVSTPTGGSSPRTPRKRRKSSSASPRTAATPPATASTIAASAPSCRADGVNRERAARAIATAPRASPPTAAREPATTSPSNPATSAVMNSDETGRFFRVATIPAAETLSAIADSAARSWWPRNDGWRQPAFQASKTSSPKNWSSATPVATAAQRTIAPSRIVRSCAATNEEWNGDREQRVLAELHEAHEVVREVLVGAARRVATSRRPARREARRRRSRACAQARDEPRRAALRTRSPRPRLAGRRCPRA